MSPARIFLIWPGVQTKSEQPRTERSATLELERNEPVESREDQEPLKKPYRTPALTALGALEEITLQLSGIHIPH